MVTYIHIYLLLQFHSEIPLFLLLDITRLTSAQFYSAQVPICPVYFFLHKFQKEMFVINKK